MWWVEALFLQACPNDPRGLAALEAMPLEEAARWCAARLILPQG